MRQSPVPVLLISATCDRLWEPGKRLRVLVPLDGSPLSEEVMEPMLTSLGQLPGDVILLQVVPRTTVPTVYLSDRSDAAISGVQECLNAASRLRQRGLQVTGLTEEGSPGTVISRVAAEQDVDLVAMATPRTLPGWLASYSAASQLRQCTARISRCYWFAQPLCGTTLVSSRYRPLSAR